jgi:hypothetical protein
MATWRYLGKFPPDNTKVIKLPTDADKTTFATHTVTTGDKEFSESNSYAVAFIEAAVDMSGNPLYEEVV